MKQKTKKYIGFFAVLIVIAFWIFLISVYPPRQIVEFVGVRNTYITIFLLASIGGFSSFTGYPLIALMGTFIAGGANPFIIGASAGLGFMIGDSLFYYFGTRARKLLSEKTKKRADKLTEWIRKKHPAYVSIFIFIYAAFLPLPNDIMTVAVSMTGHPYKRAFIPLLLGNIVHMMIIAYLASLGLEVVEMK